MASKRFEKLSLPQKELAVRITNAIMEYLQRTGMDAPDVLAVVDVIKADLFLTMALVIKEKERKQDNGRNN